MGAFDKLFGRFRVKRQVGKYFALLDGYTPIFSSYDGGIYEMELTRSCIHTFATHCSKLQPEVSGSDARGVQSMLDGKPNPFMTSAQFLYKVATIYEAQNTCFIVPLLDAFDKLIGFYPVNPQQTEVIDVDGEPWLRYTFKTGDRAAMELSRCGVVSKYLYNSDIKGENNSALMPTLQLISTQNQGIAEGIKNGASFRFMATASNFSKSTDLTRERKRWVEDNMSADAGGLALFPNTYTNVQQINSPAQIVDSEQMKLIQTRVLNYFGCNEEVLQNKAVGDGWSAYYEGKVEPFSVQLSQAMTCMVYSNIERKRNNAITWSANRLQYMTNTDKLQVSSQMFDRGVFSLNDIMDIWNLPHVEGGDKRYIRREYIEISKLGEENTQTPQNETPVEPAAE